MRFHGILLVRDEADILPQTLAHLLSWIDALHILDTGSADESWDIVQDFARRDSRVRPFGRQDVRFHNGLRAVVFNQVRHTFKPGDWVARLDADEIYHIPPPRFIAERLRPCEGRIFGQHYDFLITRAEAAAMERNPETPADLARPIELRRTRYVVQPFPEPRFFRYRRLMRWDPIRAGGYVPRRGGLIAKARIPVRHYRWRSVAQAARRVQLRSQTRAAGAPVGHHWDSKHWHDWLANDNDPSVLTWTPGQDLPDPHLTNHLPRGRRATAQSLMYRSGLVHLLDLVDLLRGPAPSSLPGLDAAAPALP